MTAHIRVPVLTGDLPATFSPEALIGLLRKELGFGGAIVSDGLEMRGASGQIGIPEAAVQALVAGNDLLCLGGEIGKRSDAEAKDQIEATATAIVEAVRTGRLTAERLEEAAARNAFLGKPAASERRSSASCPAPSSDSPRRGGRYGWKGPCPRVRRRRRTTRSAGLHRGR